MGSLLVRSPDGTEQVMRYESERLTALQDGNVVSRSRVRSRVVSARSRRCSSFSLSKDVKVRSGRRRSVSYSVHSKRSDKETHSRENLAPSGTFTWSPLPPRKAADNVCVALFCDDTWANIEQFESLIDSLPGNEMPTPTHSSASSTLRRRPKEAVDDLLGTFDDNEVEERDESFFRLEDDLSLGEDLSEGSQPPMRPFTNPRDTPTHHPPLLQSPSRKLTDIGKEDLTLESLHDLDWLQRMDPNDQMILEVHIIWSILTLMVVLLACYSIQHHSL